jgi:hypothetical protein
MKMMWLLHTGPYGVNITLFGTQSVYRVESSFSEGHIETQFIERPLLQSSSQFTTLISLSKNEDASWEYASL